MKKMSNRKNIKSAVISIALACNISALAFASSRSHMDALVQGMDYNEKVAYYWHEAKEGDAAANRYWGHMELAKAYDALGDLSEAMDHAAIAKELVSDNWEAQVFWDRLDRKLNPKPTIAAPLRNFNEKRGIDMELTLGVEHDSNIIQEEINPAVPTDKKDYAATVNLSMSHAWKSKLAGLSQESSFNFSNYTYMDHSELNLISTTLDHRLSGGIPWLGSVLNHMHRFAFNHVINDAAPLLWNLDWSSSAFWNEPQGGSRLYDARIGYRQNTYVLEGNKAQEGGSFSFALGMKDVLDKANEQNYHIGFGFIAEEPDAATSRYMEPSLSVSYNTSLPSVAWFESLQPSLDYKWRNYKTALPGSAKRNDNQWKISIGAKREIMKNQKLKLKLSYLDNDSNISSNHYRDFQGSLEYTIEY